MFTIVRLLCRTPTTALLLAALVLSSCERDTSWRQRLTIVVDTPNGEVRGSSVTEVVNTETRGAWVVPDARGVRSSVTGEAVVIEVTPGRYLLALLSGSDEERRDATHWVYPAYRLSDAGSYAGAMSIVQSQPDDAPVPLPPEGWPMMVTFDDITKPETVREVDPKNLAELFGSDVRLLAITLEITDDKVTEGQMTKVLPWLCDYRTNALRLNAESGAIFVADKSLANMLSADSFLRGYCR